MSALAPNERPQVLPVLPENIPSELERLDRWVCWRLEPRDGSWTKPPFQANGRPAKVDDPSTWTTFETALAAYRAGGFDGIGLVLVEGGGFVGVDLDKCLDRQSGELEAFARQICDELPTYCEVSPSGRGLRFFGFGRLPTGGRRKGKIEMYSGGRYLTVTGHKFNGLDAVLDITPDIAAIHARVFERPALAVVPSQAVTRTDEEIIERARAARSGPKFERLWAGDTGDYGGDHSAADLALCSLIAQHTGEGEQVNRLFQKSGLLRGKWFVPHFADGRTYGEATIARAMTPPTRPVGAEGESDPYRGSDEANAALFLKQHGQDVRYCAAWDKWLYWSGAHWATDAALTVPRLASDLPRQVYAVAAQAEDSEQRRKLARLAHTLENGRKQAALLQAARCRVIIRHDELDRNRLALNVENGTIDLATGERGGHRREDLLSHQIPIPYDPAATCPVWERFLSEVFKGDSDLIAFIQRAIGHSLTAEVTEQVLLLCYGHGSNGKSVFLNVLRRLLGPLALQAAPDLLMADHNRRHPTEQADLFGKRLVVCQETAEGRRFNEVLVKQLTGGDAIRARRMHEDFWEFNPTHKIWLSTNHRPEIRGTDHAIWRRIRLIPFSAVFGDDASGTPGDFPKDPRMETKLLAELPGILAWAVRGCLNWQREGLGAPSAVTEATREYRGDMDRLWPFIAERCTVRPTESVQVGPLYQDYVTWAMASGERPDPMRVWATKMAERGFTRERRNAGIFWVGIGLAKPFGGPQR